MGQPLLSRLPTTEKILWLLFLANVLIVVGGIIGLAHGTVFNAMVTYLPLTLVTTHASWTLGTKRGLAFIVLAGFTGFMAEAISLNHGTLFGGNYVYSPNTGLAIAKVPLAVITYWAIFIYIGYWLVTTTLYWLNGEKPARNHGSLVSLIGLAIADGLAVTAIDLLMDPVSVKSGTWKWIGGGPYFEVPIGNFVGWFVVTILVTGLFRTLEYYQPPTIKRNRSVLLLPVLGYLLVGLDFLLSAASYHLAKLVIIGILFVIIPALVNVAFYWRGRKVAY